MVDTPHTQKIGDDQYGYTHVLTRVWVYLDVILGRQPDDPVRTAVDGIDMSGRVVGRLHGRLRSKTGEWLGVVDFEVPYADGRPHQVRLKDQLVPFRALSKVEET